MSADESSNDSDNNCAIVILSPVVVCICVCMCGGGVGECIVKDCPRMSHSRHLPERKGRPFPIVPRKLRLAAKELTGGEGTGDGWMEWTRVPPKRFGSELNA